MGVYTVDNRWVNGKRTPAIHAHVRSLRADLSAVRYPPRPISWIASAQFAFPQEHDAAREWFTEYFEQRVIVRHSRQWVSRRCHREWPDDHFDGEFAAILRMVSGADAVASGDAPISPPR